MHQARSFAAYRGYLGLMLWDWLEGLKIGYLTEIIVLLMFRVWGVTWHKQWP